MASTYIYRGSGESTGNRRTFTWSAWIKRGKISDQQIIAACSADSSNRGYLYFTNGDAIGWTEDGGSTDIYTTRKFMDTNAWYHIVFANDTTQATASNRMKLYVNGEQVALDGGSQPAQNYLLHFNRGGSYIPYIGTRAGSNPDYFDGCMSHVAHVDGTQELPTIFGTTDNVTGVWSIKTSITPSSGWGTNGYHILKDGNSGTDQSGQSNNWTVRAGTLTKTEDCPSNIFCIMNSPSASPTITFTNGNTGLNYSSSVESGKGTLAFSSGKFYWEAKITVATNYPMLGIGSYEDYRMQSPLATGYPGQHTNSYGAYGNGNVYANGSNTGSQSFTWSTNDIIGIAVDLDSGTKTIKWFKNGSQIATYNITASSTFSPYDYNGGEAGAGILYNFGNGYFGTTAVSSAGTNASNNGIFEYDVPSGYTALSTKGLNL